MSKRLEILYITRRVSVWDIFCRGGESLREKDEEEKITNLVQPVESTSNPHCSND